MFLKTSGGWRKAGEKLHHGNLRSNKRGWRYDGGRGGGAIKRWTTVQ